ncbi:MAG TPA: ABC transporter substrate-binding protein [Gemmatimonadales bacterium]|jgi:putative ABC transport system substrate-binding protein
MRPVARVLAVLPLGLFSVAQAPSPPPQRGAQIVVVVSQDAPPYKAALSSFQRTLSAGKSVDLKVVQLEGDSARASQLMGTSTKANLVLTLGTLATRETLRRYRGVPTVAGMILSPDELQGAANATGVFLQFPVETELEWLSRIAPSIHRIGIIYHSEESKARVVQAEKLASGANLNIQAYQIDRPQELPDALENLADRADALWGVTDPMVFNPETAKSLLLFSFRHQIPLIGHSTPWVKAGALYALDRDYTDIGVQCAEMAGKILAGQSASSLPPVPPRKVRYTLNRKTAEQMKLDLPDRAFRDAAEVVE